MSPVLGPKRPTVASQHVGSYLGYTGRGANAFGKGVPEADIGEIGRKNFFACELLHSRMAHPVLTAGTTAAHFGRLADARTGLKDRFRLHSTRAERDAATLPPVTNERGRS
jgi:hypothetical protein